LGLPVPALLEHGRRPQWRPRRLLLLAATQTQTGGYDSNLGATSDGLLHSAPGKPGGGLGGGVSDLESTLPPNCSVDGSVLNAPITPEEVSEGAMLLRRKWAFSHGRHCNLGLHRGGCLGGCRDHPL